MSSYNSVTIVGGIGFIDKESFPFTLTVATDRRVKDKNSGEYTKVTDWHKICMFGKAAESAKDMLEKGDKALFEGTLTYYKTEREGVKVTYTSILCYKFVKLSPKKKESDGNTKPQKQEFDDDEIPF